MWRWLGPLYREVTTRPPTFRIELTEEDRVQRLLLIRQGKTPARALLRAHVLLRAAEGAFDRQSALHVSLRTIQMVRQRFARASGEERLESGPMLVVGTPQPTLPACDAHSHFVQVPHAAGAPFALP